ncbi:Ig-like domain-containing protein [Bacillus massiliigorillae]|uniref:Ig-like domain-containing protein n=1 Tax=Bacillus massiliigorillae TaxID=1243664 RepID=UPI0003A0724E|nr:Ig-like domain-containing protein [Bacillus massiliigorillae]
MKKKKYIMSLALACVLTSSTILSGTGIFHSEAIAATSGDYEAPKLVTPIGIVGDSRDYTIKGALDREAIVRVVIYNNNNITNGIELTSTETPSKEFEVKIPKQKANTKITFEFIGTDEDKSTSCEIVTVQDTTPPEIKRIDQISDTSKYATGNVSEPGVMTATYGNKTIGTVMITEANRISDNKYEFSLELDSFYKKGDVLAFQMKDNATPSLESKVVNVTVKSDGDEPSLVTTPIVTNNSTIVEGKVNKIAYVQLFVDEKPLNANPFLTDKDGNFKMPIAKQPSGTDIKIVIKDAAGNFNTDEIIVTVTDVIAPIITKVDEIYDTTSIITGESDKEIESVNVEMYNSTSNEWKVVTTTFTNELKDDIYKLAITLGGKLPIGTKIKIVAEDSSSNKSKEYIAIVKDDLRAPKLETTLSLVEGQTVINGKLNKKGTIEAVIDKETILDSGISEPLPTKKDGSFSINVKSLIANKKVTFIFKDTKRPTPNQTKLVVTVNSKADNEPPVVVVKDIFNSSKVISGTVNKPGVVTATLGNRVLGKVTVKESARDKNGLYPFTVSLKNVLNQNDIVTIQAVDNLKPQQESEVVHVTVKKDTTQPTLEVTPKITDQTTSIVGKSSKEATVQLYANDKPLLKNSAKTDALGNFKFTIKKQTIGTKISFELIDLVGNKTKSDDVIVKDGVPPVIKKVNAVYDTSTVIEGELSEAGEVTMDIGQSKVTKTTDKNRKFTFSLEKLLPKDTPITLTAMDSAGNVTKKATVIKVKADTTPPKLLEPKTIVIDDTGDSEVTGKIDEAGTVDVLVNGESILQDKKPVKIGNKGLFTVKVPKQPANTKLIFLFKDKSAKGNVSKKTVVVKDATPPVLEEPTLTKSADEKYYIVSGKVNEKASIKATDENGKSLGSATAKLDNDGKYQYSIKISIPKSPKPPITKITITAKDSVKTNAPAVKTINVN